VSDVLARLAARLRDDGELPPETIGSPRGEAIHGPATAAGPRARADPARYELLVEAIYEGYLLHYGRGRVVVTDDGDLALLAGDRLYALGIAELAALGDLDAVRELADAISLAAQAHADGDGALAEAVWRGAVRGVGWGPSEALDRAKALARDGDPDAATALAGAAAERPRDVA
jgi:hypothetical protein